MTSWRMVHLIMCAYLAQWATQCLSSVNPSPLELQNVKTPPEVSKTARKICLAIAQRFGEHKLNSGTLGRISGTFTPSWDVICCKLLSPNGIYCDLLGSDTKRLKKLVPGGEFFPGRLSQPYRSNKKPEEASKHHLQKQLNFISLYKMCVQSSPRLLPHSCNLERLQKFLNSRLHMPTSYVPTTESTYPEDDKQILKLQKSAFTPTLNHSLSKASASWPRILKSSLLPPSLTLKSRGEKHSTAKTNGKITKVSYQLGSNFSASVEKRPNLMFESDLSNSSCQPRLEEDIFFLSNCVPKSVVVPVCRGTCYSRSIPEWDETMSEVRHVEHCTCCRPRRRLTTHLDFNCRDRNGAPIVVRRTVLFPFECTCRPCALSTMRRSN